MRVLKHCGFSYRLGSTRDWAGGLWLQARHGGVLRPRFDDEIGLPLALRTL
jgi:hypothetical protein